MEDNEMIKDIEENHNTHLLDDLEIEEIMLYL